MFVMLHCESTPVKLGYRIDLGQHKTMAKYGPSTSLLLATTKHVAKGFQNMLLFLKKLYQGYGLFSVLPIVFYNYKSKSKC